MPILSRYLLKNYLRVLLIAVISFIMILLVSRLEEIAQFATLGAKPIHLLSFTLYQIPYILPLALPISCLLSSMILFKRLCHDNELTAIRSSGINLRRILTPILFAGAIISLLTFYVASELATASHLATRKMMYELTSVNPLLLLQSAKIAQLKGSFVQMDTLKKGESAQNLCIALNNASQGRINLCLAKHIEMQGKNLIATNVSLISGAPSNATQPDHLVIENQSFMSSSAPEFAKLLRKGGWKMANDHLKFSLLRIRSKMLKAKLSQDPSVRRALNKCYTEIVRRTSVSLAAFTFTLLGASFGMEIGRNRKQFGLTFTLIIASGCLICFCMAKALSALFWISTALFIIPHLIAFLASFWTLRRISKGIE